MIADARLPWFPCYPGKLLGALADMSPDQQLIYVVVLLRIYDVGGPCADPLDSLARRIRINRRRTTEALDSLFRLGKLVSTRDGIINPFAEQVLVSRQAKHRERARAGAAGGTRAAEIRKGNQKTPPSKAAAKLKHLDLEEERTLFPTETRPGGGSEPSATLPLDPEADLYRRGREILGQSAGGMIRKLLAAKGGNVALARAAVEQASTRGNAREYVGAMVRGGPRGGGKNGFAALARRSLNEEKDEEHDAGSREDDADRRALPAPFARQA